MVNNIEAGVSKMTVGAAPKPQSFLMKFELTYTFTMHNKNDNEMCHVDLFPPTLPQKHFKPDVIAEGTKLEISIQVPNFFWTHEHGMVANLAVVGFNANTSKA